MKPLDFLGKLCAQFPMNDEYVAAVKEYIQRFSESELARLWGHFDQWYDSDKMPTVGTLRKMASDIGLRKGQGTITEYILRCKLCGLHRTMGTGPCPHCLCFTTYVIVETSQTPEQADAGRKLSPSQLDQLQTENAHLVAKGAKREATEKDIAEVIKSLTDRLRI